MQEENVPLQHEASSATYQHFGQTCMFNKGGGGVLTSWTPPSLDLPLRYMGDIPDNTMVWVTSGSDALLSRVTSSASTPPYSYVVSTPGGEVCRNLRNLTVIPVSNND